MKKDQIISTIRNLEWKKILSGLLQKIKENSSYIKVGSVAFICNMALIIFMVKGGPAPAKPPESILFNTEQSRVLIEPYPSNGKEPEYQVTILSVRGDTYVVTILTKSNIEELYKKVNPNFKGEYK